MSYHLSQIAEICQGELHGADSKVECFVCDSRRIDLGSSSLFIAIKGSGHDGHLFIPDAMKSGVRCFLVDRKEVIEQNASFILVDDSLKAFQALAIHHRAKFDYPVIGITGSDGKNQVKELLASILHNRYKIIQSPEGSVSKIGVPLAIMAMESVHELGILVVGISKSGEMAGLEPMISPDIGIITAIASAHDEGFLSKKERVLEEIKLFSNSSIIIYPRDKELIHSTILERFGATDKHLAHWGNHPESFLHLVELKKGKDKTVLTYCTGGKSHTLELNLTNEKEFENMMTALVGSHILGLEAEEIASLIQESRPRPRANSQFLETDFAQGLLVAFGTIDGPSVRTAKEQLQALSKAEQVTAVFSKSECSPFSMDKKIEELQDALQGSKVIFVGSGWENLQEGLSDTSEVKDVIEFKNQAEKLIDRGSAILLMGESYPALLSLKGFLQSRSHQTSVLVNFTSLIHNLNVYRAILDPGVKVMVMVKAFAYGNGATEVARILDHHRVDYLAVAYPDEGVALRKAGIELPIMVLNSARSEFDSLIEHRLEPEIYSLSFLKAFVAFCDDRKLKDYPIHLMVDTGMHRLGISTEEVAEALEILDRTKSLHLVSVMSHLFASDGDDLSLAEGQVSQFEEIRLLVIEAIQHEVLFHILNSSGISRLPDAQMDMVRLGIGLYGFSGDKQLNENLLPVISWYTCISQIKDVKSGGTVGYGGTLRLEEDTRIAVLPVGYADGLSRSLGNGVGQVVIRGMACPFVGNICMDMSMVDITGLECSETDQVEIIGEHITIEHLAEQMGTIPYEVLTSIPPRVKRSFIFNGQQYEGPTGQY